MKKNIQEALLEQSLWLFIRQYGILTSLRNLSKPCLVESTPLCTNYLCCLNVHSCHPSLPLAYKVADPFVLDSAATVSKTT